MWNIKRAVAYLEERRRIGAQGANPASMRDARQRYDQVKSIADRKLAEMPKGNLAAVLKKGAFVDKQIKKDIALAEYVNPLLVELGGYLAFMTDAQLICGPLKEGKDALRKTIADYKGQWVNNKDLVRCTLACETQTGLKKIVIKVKDICSPLYGMQLIKIAETTVKSKDNACGYSGWNFAAVFKGIRIPVEIQANTFAMMYGKMSQDKYTECVLGGDVAEYPRTEKKMGFPGGLSHLFYEIWREDKAGVDGKAAAALGCWYSDLCRMEEAERKNHAPNCRRKYAEFSAKLTNPKALKVVKEHPLDHRWACACGSDTCYLATCS